MEAEVSRVRMNPMNPTNRENKNPKIRVMLFTEVGVPLVSKEKEFGGQHRIELLEEEERERTTPIDAFDPCFMTQANADTFPILICRDSKSVKR